MTHVSIVILNWNGRSFLEQFLPPLVKYSDVPGAEIVVADNGSTDDSVAYLQKEWPQIKIVVLEQNYGFSGGYNRAFEQLDSTYFLLLNSDIEVTPGWLEPLLETMEKDAMVAACTSKIKDFHNRTRFEYAGAAGGYIDRLGYPFCRGRIFDQLEEDRGQYDDPRQVFWGSGACLLVRSNLYMEAGGLDEKFFAHMEEIDLCWRLQRMGFVIRYAPGSTIYHVGGGTLKKGDPQKTFLNFRNNLLLLYKNLPVKNRDRIIFFRMLLDGVSALRFLLQGSFTDFWAVFRSHFAFYGMKHDYDGSPQQNKQEKNNDLAAGIYPRSIVSDFFLKGKKQFNQLPFSE